MQAGNCIPSLKPQLSVVCSHYGETDWGGRQGHLISGAGRKVIFKNITLHSISVGKQYSQIIRDVI